MHCTDICPRLCLEIVLARGSGPCARSRPFQLHSASEGTWQRSKVHELLRSASVLHLLKQYNAIGDPVSCRRPENDRRLLTSLKSSAINYISSPFIFPFFFPWELDEGSTCRGRADKSACFRSFRFIFSGVPSSGSLAECYGHRNPLLRTSSGGSLKSNDNTATSRLDSLCSALLDFMQF